MVQPILFTQYFEKKFVYPIQAIMHQSVHDYLRLCAQSFSSLRHVGKSRLETVAFLRIVDRLPEINSRYKVRLR